MDFCYSTINIYDRLKLKYRDYLKPEIISVEIVQSKDEVWLETKELEIVEGGLEKYTINRISLDFIKDVDEDADGDEVEKLFFDPEDSIENNARKFIEELTPYSIINTTDLFHEEACEKISRKYNTFGIDK